MTENCEESYEIKSQISIRSITMLIDLLNGEVLTYEKIYDEYEISYSTYKRHIREIKEALEETHYKRYVLIKDKNNHYKLLTFDLPFDFPIYC